MVIFLACVKSIGIFFIFYYSSISALGLYKAFVCSSLIFIQFYTASLAFVPSNESAWVDYKLPSLHKWTINHRDTFTFLLAKYSKFLIPTAPISTL